MVDSENSETWDDRHMVFLRPFMMFVLYETGIRDALRDLKKKWQIKEHAMPTEKANDDKLEEQKREAEKCNDAEMRKTNGLRRIQQ